MTVLAYLVVDLAASPGYTYILKQFFLLPF